MKSIERKQGPMGLQASGLSQDPKNQVKGTKESLGLNPFNYIAKITIGVSPLKSLVH